ncbi:MAG: cobalamin biosynthesis protein [Lachnospiraceae bacterium]|nr:cobalamin biosynthesis protein [Lachnospiraceae bacterium]
MTIGMIACSRQAYERMQTLKHKLTEAQQDITVLDRVKCSALQEKSMTQSLTACVKEWWDEVDAIVFLCAAGIAVRSIAPCIGHKSTDPAVVVIDETGTFCISLLSGHMGGGNELAMRLAGLLHAMPVITTATDREGKFAVDDFARKNHMVISDWKKAKDFAVHILNGGTVFMTAQLSAVEVCGNPPDGVVWEQPEGQRSGQHTEPPEAVSGQDSVPQAAESRQDSVAQMAESGLDSVPWAAESGQDSVAPEAVSGQDSVMSAAGNEQDSMHIIISYRDKPADTEEKASGCLQLVPRVIAVGIGCKKNTPKEKIAAAVRQCLREEHVLPEAVFIVSSIDLKKQERGLVDYCSERSLPFVTYSADALNQLEGDFTASSFVGEVTGVSNVCERSAVLASEGMLLCRKKVYDGVTVALAEKKGRVIF